MKLKYIILIAIFSSRICEAQKISTSNSNAKQEVSSTTKKILYPVCEDIDCKRMGFADKNGNLFIPCSYDEVGDFHNGFAYVYTNGSCGLINEDGVLVMPCEYQHIYEPSEGLILAKKDDQYSFYNIKGQHVLKCDYESVSPFSDGMAMVRQNEKYGFINKSGKLLVECKYEKANYFSEGIAKVVLERKDGFVDAIFINKLGKLAFPGEYYSGNDDLNGSESIFKSGVIGASKDGTNWGLLNKMGKWVVPPKYKRVGNCKEGLINALNEEDTWGYLNSFGKVVIPFQYSIAQDFQEGMAKVNLVDQSGWAFINKKGELKIPPTYSAATEYNNGLVRVLVDARTQYYVDKEGNQILRYHMNDKLETVSNLNIGDNFTYSGTMKNGLPHGHGKWTNTDGSWYEGEFKDGKENGIGTRRNPDGIRYYGTFKDGAAHGIFTAKQWTLGGLISNEWYAEYNMGKLVSSQKTKSDFDDFLNGTKNSSATSSSTSGTSSSTTKIKIEYATWKYCEGSYRLYTYINDKLTSPPTKLTESYSVISRDKNNTWWTGCTGEMMNEEIGKNLSLTEAIKAYYKLRFETSYGAGTFELVNK